MWDYFDTNGTNKDAYGEPDHWGGCTEFSADLRCTRPPYMRNTSHPFAGMNGKNITIEEPCNYVSNIAFYHSATRICDYPDWKMSKSGI